MRQFMAGLDLDPTQKSSSASKSSKDPYQHFSKLFRKEIKQVQEYSFDEDVQGFGACILGSGKEFFKRFFQFTDKVTFFKPWKSEFKRFSLQDHCTSYGVKVDWKDTDVTHVTLYSRAFPNHETYLLKKDWKGLQPLELAQLFNVQLPFCFAIRCGIDKTLSFSTYIDVHQREHQMDLKIPVLLERFNWHKSVGHQILKDALYLSPKGFKGCIGIESSGKLLKLDFTGLGLGCVIRFLRSIGVSEKRLQELLLAASDLKQIQPNYFALKYNEQGLLGWKVYFVKLG